MCSLDGEAKVLNFPERELQRHIPFSSLPQEVLDLHMSSWVELASGRWRWADHNTLGEGRGAVRGLELLSRHKGSRERVFMSLQDNLTFASAAAKGRRGRS